MKFSYRWLRELVEGLDLDARALSQQITMKTAESEGVEPFGLAMERVVAARILAVEPLPGTSAVRATIDAGRLGHHHVVCGAPNCRPGMTTAYVPPGTRLAEGEIQSSEVHGVLSEGMLASGIELGLNRDDEGILKVHANPGDPVPGCVPDQIIEIDNKSLTHRPDLWGHHGMAREVAALTGLPLHDPVHLTRLPNSSPAPRAPHLASAPSHPAPQAPLLTVSIADPHLCPRYSALVFENVTVEPSPLWLQYRLSAIGLNPISNIVDVTNYVMAELAQPMHAFDADRLQGTTIHVRLARDGEPLTALNDVVYSLTAADLVIADDAGAVALAGVIGGRDSAIHDGTRRIVLESANFHPSTVRKTSSRHGLRTDASTRFEKSQDPANTVRALARAVALLEDVCPGIRLVGTLVDSYTPRPAAPPIDLPIPWLQRKLGKAVPAKEVETILRALEFGVERVADDLLRITVPTWRATKDVSLKEDLVEEVGRMIGYGTIPPQPPLVAAIVPHVDEERAFHGMLRRLVAAQGYTEVYNYSFLSEEAVQRFGLDLNAHLRVLNPIASDQGLLRVSLVPGVVGNAVENAKYLDSFRLFEIGREIHPRGTTLPDEVPHLVALLYQRHGDGKQNLSEARQLLEALAPGAVVEPASPRTFEHPARAGAIEWKGEPLGRLFEVHPSFITGRAAVLDLDVGVLFRRRPSVSAYAPIRRTPSTAFDLSVLVPSRSLVGELQRQIQRHAGPYLQRAEYLRQFEGDPLPLGQKSVSFRVTLAAPDRTLSSQDAGDVRASLIQALEQAGYGLRGS